MRPASFGRLIVISGCSHDFCFLASPIRQLCIFHLQEDFEFETLKRGGCPFCGYSNNIQQA